MVCGVFVVCGVWCMWRGVCVVCGVMWCDVVCDVVWCGVCVFVVCCVCVCVVWCVCVYTRHRSLCETLWEMKREGRERDRFYFRDEESLGFVKTSLVPLNLDRYFALVYILILQAVCNQ